MKVEQLMTEPVFTCRPEDTLARVAQILSEKDCGCILVVNGHTDVVGIVTDRDALIASYRQGKLLPDIPVASAMTRRVECCHPDNTIAVAEEKMAAHRVRRLPVTDERGRLIGILALDDIAREAARERWREDREVSDAEVGKTLAAVCKSRRDRAGSAVSRQVTAI